jgi:hypothetical protein
MIILSSPTISLAFIFFFFWFDMAAAKITMLYRSHLGYKYKEQAKI